MEIQVSYQKSYVMIRVNYPRSYVEIQENHQTSYAGIQEDHQISYVEIQVSLRNEKSLSYSIAAYVGLDFGHSQLKTTWSYQGKHWRRVGRKNLLLREV